MLHIHTGVHMSSRSRARTVLGVVLASLGVLLAPTAASPAVAPAALGVLRPRCVTPAAADAFEPPCNPYLSSPSWGMAHRNPYAQASSPYPAPEPGDPIGYHHATGVLGVTLFAQYTEPYADGGRNLWMATVATPDGRYVYKADARTGAVISGFGSLNDLSLPGVGGVSGAYSLLDRNNNLIVGRERSFDVYGDSVSGDRFSPIKRIAKFTLPDSVLCGPDDALVGITMLYDGRVAFASALGVVGTFPSNVADMTAANVVTTSINGARCATATADDSSLDTVSNSIAADETGGIFVVTSKAMYRFGWNGKRISRTWAVPYASGTSSSVRIGEGSGSTPTLMGTSAQRDRFVVITDGQELMHLNLYWRDAVPADWPGIPGEDRRLACSIPVRFGDPAATVSQSEQSVLVRGYASVVVNNQLKDDSAFASLSGNARLLAAALAGGDPNNAPYGIERLDWNPRTRTCSSVWVNSEVSIPNGIPSMSTDSGLIYGMGQRDGVWGLEGLDFATGASALRVDTSASPEFNSTYSAATVGPDGSIWTGGVGGYTIFRETDQTLPLSCPDPSPLVSLLGPLAVSCP